VFCYRNDKKVVGVFVHFRAPLQRMRLDAYNANPSMAVAIDNFLQLQKPNKIITLEMFELGDESQKRTC
jgi:UDP-N-acetylmuramyl pentapeptide synthase